MSVSQGQTVSIGKFTPSRQSIKRVSVCTWLPQSQPSRGVTSWPINLQSFLGSSLLLLSHHPDNPLRPTFVHTAALLCLVCVCVLCLQAQSISNGTSSEEVVWQCSYTMQQQVRPQGLSKATRSDVLCGASVGANEETPSQQRTLEKQQFGLWLDLKHKQTILVT